MLFSEPKIPQSVDRARAEALLYSFSALQRAENSSMAEIAFHREDRLRFSALQRAENSSIRPRACRGARRRSFQCSSASRKFLNRQIVYVAISDLLCFSALQRAENSSIVERNRLLIHAALVSVLFSEPKIPQSNSSV